MQFNFTCEPNVSLEQRIGFEMAALIWSSFLTDDVTVDLRIGVTDELGENGRAVGGAIPTFHETQYGVYQNYLQQDAHSDEDHSVLAALQEGNTVDFLVANDDDDGDEDDSDLVDGNTEMMLTRAQAKALGMEEALVLDNGTTWDRDVLQNSNSLDGYIINDDGDEDDSDLVDGNTEMMLTRAQA
ncbi:MAG: NF038122 family metalloprotease, partial [Cyanobacteria bacterium J06636_16]